jgi:DNA-binding transcriptional regulator YdaS (Cro superfamily)
MTILNDLRKRRRGVVDLAKLCGVVPSTVSEWTRVPVHHVMTIAREKKIHPHDLRPDIYPAEMPWEGCVLERLITTCCDA